MFNKRICLAGLVVLLLLVIFIACKDSGSGGDLPVNTIDWQPDGSGFTQFYTNDSSYYNYGFSRTIDNPNENNFYEIECKKISGYDGMGYGMVFGRDVTNNYQILISRGDYVIRKRIGDSYTIIKHWSASLHLYSGYGQINKIKAVNNNNTYTVYFNEQEICDFTDNDVAGSKIGFLASVGSEADESFPNTPVDIRFRLP